MTTLVRSPEGENRREVNLETLDIPDLWHVAMHLLDQGEKRFSDMVLDCWHLTHDLKNHALDD